MNHGKRNRAILSVIILILSGCSHAVITPGTTVHTVLPITPTSAYSPTASGTPTDTPTPTITETPTITPTPTPPPDLELTNVTIFPDTYNSAGGIHVLMGRIRNNTKTPMVNYDSLVIFQFNFESWEFNKSATDLKYFHTIFQRDIKVSKYYLNTNCILYPGEEGVIDFQLDSGEPRIFFEKTNDYIGPLGVWYTYKSYFQAWPDLPKMYRLKAENVAFQKNDIGISFSFDIDIPIPLSKTGVDNPTWVIFYDSGGKIINILHKNLIDYPGYYVGRRLHVSTNTFTTGGSLLYFTPSIEITPDMVARVDHLEVMMEMDERIMCNYPRF